MARQRISAILQFAFDQLLRNNRWYWANHTVGVSQISVALHFESHVAHKRNCNARRNRLQEWRDEFRKWNVVVAVNIQHAEVLRCLHLTKFELSALLENFLKLDHVKLACVIAIFKRTCCKEQLLDWAQNSLDLVLSYFVGFFLHYYLCLTI